jgi:hypothetical protein
MRPKGEFLIRAFRERLLVPTLAFSVRNSAFYKRHLGNAWRTVTSVESLSALPITSKEMLRRTALDEILTSEDVPVVVQHTSGTTDEPFRVYRSHAEIEFIRTFFASSLGRLEGTGLGVIALQPPYHGEPVEVPVPSEYRNVDILHLADLSPLVTSLSQDKDSTRALIMTGIFTHVRYLTACLHQMGFEFGSHCVKGMFVTGQYVSKRWRKIIEDDWRLPLGNRFSLTEGFGGATECGQCGAWHFEQYVVPEVLDFDQAEPVREGAGILHLTSLFPFVQLMPFIRYRTNDIVSVEDSECTAGDGRAYRMLGRWDYAAAVKVRGKTRLLIPPGELYELFDEMPEVEVECDFDRQARLGIRTGVGDPKFEVWVSEAADVPRIGVEFSLAFNPWLYRTAASEVAQEVRRRILRRFEELRRLVAQDVVKLEVGARPPGVLESFEPSAIPGTVAAERS